MSAPAGTVAAGLHGRSVLVVEDDQHVGALLVEMLHDQGCSVLGPYARLPDALHAARHAQFDLAVLDVDLAGEDVTPVADVLGERGIGFLVVTGYGHAALPHGRTDWACCPKPFSARVLLAQLRGQLKGN